MAVAKNQVEELATVLLRYLSIEALWSLTVELRTTTACKNNRSFAETIRRLQDYLRTR